MAGFNQLYVDVGPIGTNHHVSAFVFLAGHSLMICRIALLALIMNGRRNLASGCPGAEFVPCVPSGRSDVHDQICHSSQNRRANSLSSWM